LCKYTLFKLKRAIEGSTLSSIFGKKKEKKKGFADKEKMMTP
jgi:hypothetical protein